MNKKEYMKMALGGTLIFLLLTQIPVFLHILLLYPLMTDLTAQNLTWIDIFKGAFLEQNLIPFSLMLIAGIVLFIVLKSESKANNDKVMGGAYLFGGVFSAIFLIGFTPNLSVFSFALYSNIVRIIKNYTAGVDGGYAVGEIVNVLKPDIILACILIVALALAVILVLIGLSKLTDSKKDEEYTSAFDDADDTSDWVVSAAEEDDNSVWQGSEVDSADSASADAGEPEAAEEASVEISEEVSEEVLDEAAEKTDEK